MRRIVLVTGLQAAGKTTVGRLLAEQLPGPSAALDGDVFDDMVAAGGAFMTSTPSPEALRHLALRYEASALVAQHYALGGFDVVCSDIILEQDVSDWMESLRGVERHLVVLVPSVDAIANRETSRGKNSYRDWRGPGDTLADAVRAMSVGLNDIPRHGLWLDTTDQTAEQTAASIMSEDMRPSLY